MHRLIRGVAAAVVVLPLAGCDGSPAGPGSAGLAPAEQVHAFLPAVSDAAERVVPGLGDVQVRAALQAQLVALNEHLVHRDVHRIHRAVAEIRSQLLKYGATGRAEDGPELSAIELVLDGVQRLLFEQVQ